MARKRRYGTCTYCGADGPVSFDHTPPASMYTPSAPSGAPQVDSCDRCNHGSSKDDEYFRDTVLKFHRVGEKEVVAPLVEKMLRAAAMPEKAAYARRQLEAFTTIDAYTPSGLYLGKRDAFRVDNARMERAAVRYIRGLHQFCRGAPVPPGYHVTVSLNPERVIQTFERTIELFAGAGMNVVQEGVFKYSLAVPPDNTAASAWLLIFYDEFPMLGFVMPDRDAPG